MVDVAYAPFLPQIGAFAEASSADDTFLGDFNDHKAYTIGANSAGTSLTEELIKMVSKKPVLKKLKQQHRSNWPKKGSLCSTIKSVPKSRASIPK
jgi:outer membrane protein